ncbi:MAG: DUF4178 domain-containing protein [Acidobacteriota bacterium]|nr:DUF4178 domain-containing protein [Blastocatellia bacterium]MDW8411056.1 DUF4178 domain-containing protein [Acidobacteriota bacterium]
MMKTTCPSCGAEITFRAKSSVLGVCQYCHSLLLRSGAKLEEIGKVADLVDIKTPLYAGLNGKYSGVDFYLVGRTQIKHELGGIWTEWYAYFSDGEWGWITEAQGRFYVTFAVPVAQVPSFQSLIVGQQAKGIPFNVPLVVAEKGQAQYLAAEGEVPFYFTPGEKYYYADLSGPNSEFVTIDYSEQQPLLFVGRQVTLQELGIDPQQAVMESATIATTAEEVKVKKLNCPHCAAPLELRAPDQTERIACQYCGSLLQVDQGELRFIKALTKPEKAPIIPIGSQVKFDSKPMTVIGWMVRSTVVEGVKYFWEEFLLYNPSVGFEWLVWSDLHWMHVKPIQPGQVRLDSFERVAYYNGNQYKLFNRNFAEVEFVLGEFYWKVEVGEQTLTRDYVRPGWILSQEISGQSTSTGEVNWSHGRYVYPDEIEWKFKIKVPRPQKPGMCEPWSEKSAQNYGCWIMTDAHSSILKYWVFFSSILIVMVCYFVITLPEITAYEKSLSLEPLANNSTATQVVFSEPFDLKDRLDILVNASAPSLDNSWLYFEGHLINEETGLVQPFSMDMEYYHGVDIDDEGAQSSWTEGSTSKIKVLSALPTGKYILRIEAQWEKWQMPMQLLIKITQGNRGSAITGFLIILLLISLLPAYIMIRAKLSIYDFEIRKWSESYTGASDEDSYD